jgi:hypothetical protein
MPQSLEDLMLDRQLMASHTPTVPTQSTIGPLTGREKPFYNLDFSKGKVTPADALVGAGRFINDLFEISPKSPIPGMEAIAGPGGPAAAKDWGLKLIGRLRTLPSFQGISPELLSALTLARSKYPRLFGHVSSVKVHPLKDRAIGRQSGSGPYSNLEFDPALIDVSDPYETVGHELAHVAQNLRKGSNKFEDQYGYWQDTFGYRRNPLEVSARKSGAKFSKGPR